MKCLANWEGKISGMRTFLVVLVVLAVAWVYHYRERLYVHDVVAKVYVGGVEQTEVSAYINASNDVLLMNPMPPTLLLVRHGDAAPVIAGTLSCVHWVGCMTEVNAGVSSGERDARIAMSPKVVTFVDGAGRAVRVELY